MTKELVPSSGSSLFPRLPLRGFGLGRDLFRDYERMVDSMFRGPMLGSDADEIVTPRIDVVETDKNIEVLADLPGVDEKDIKVELRNGTLWLSAEKKDERKEESKNMYRSERCYGSFERGVALPCDVEKNSIEAVYRDGVLKVVLPKTAQAREEVTHIKVKH